MTAPISIVIPTLNAEASLSPCLTALMEGLEAGVIRELIVVDGGSGDTTPALAQAWGADVIEAAPSRGGQLRKGCAAARGDWLLVLHADTVLAPGWARHVRNHIARSHEAAWFKLRFDSEGVAARFVAAWANLRSRFGLPYGDQGLLIPMALYHQVGGYRDIPLMEDVALARALRGKMRGLPGIAVTSAAKYVSQGWFRRGSRNLWTLLRYFLGADTGQLGVQYRR
ncbi:MAG: TIGR04283 family arsenosugar biosynthesis glycosyltransferase [Pseudomonadota bacterium]